MSFVPGAGGVERTTERRVMPATAQLLDDVLNQLQVTDRVFHGLKQSMPLVRRLVDSVEGIAPGGSVLVVGSNTLLARALTELGHPVELWHVPEGSLTGDLKIHVTRTATLEELLARTEGDKEFDVIVLPYILEAVAEEPGAALSRLRERLAPEGRILVASASAGRLIYRLRALTGRSQLQPAEGSAPVSLSWPSLPVRRLIDPENLRHWAGEAGFQVEDHHLMMDKDATMPIEAMRVKDWILAEGTHLIRRTVPGLQDCLVATLAPFRVKNRPALAGAGEAPAATVVVFATDSGRTARLLSDLDEQTFPPDRMDVVVVHPPDPVFDELDSDAHRFRLALMPFNPPAGPRAANAAMQTSTAEVVAFTDDACRVPPAWVESGVAATSGWTAAATGEVLSAAGPSPVLNLPGARQTRGVELDRGFFPAWNSFYLREALSQIGGFDETFEDESGPCWGWDSEPAYRLQAVGYRTSFEDTIFVFREFPPPEPEGWVAAEFRRASQIPGGVGRMPGLRRTQLRERIFATHRTRGFLLLLLGALLARERRSPGYLLLAFPWAKSAVSLLTLWPPSRWPKAAADVGLLAVRHSAWLAGFLKGFAKSRRVVL